MRLYRLILIIFTLNSGVMLGQDSVVNQADPVIEIRSDSVADSQLTFSPTGSEEST